MRDLQCADFAAAIVLRRTASPSVAEERDHHPDILVHSWNGVRLSLSTHSAGGLTAADFELAGAIDELSVSRRGRATLSAGVADERRALAGRRPLGRLLAFATSLQ